jgi:hypothetical protein
MANHQFRRRSVLAVPSPATLAGTRIKQAVAVVTMLLVTFPCFAQSQTQPPSPPDSQTSSQAPAPPQPSTVIIPAGTRFALVLTHPIQTRYVQRGDDIYAQLTAPVTSGDEVVIPPGTLVDGKVDKLQRRSGRAELYLQSMTVTFSDGYVAPISGPMVLESSDAYVLKDPGPGRIAGAFALPVAGAGLGALIGHSVASSQNTTITNTLPPGCVGPPPGCLSSSLSVPPNKGKSTVIGAAVGAAIGGVTSLLLLTNSHNFFLDVGSPVEMVLQQPLSLEGDPLSGAVGQSEQSPVEMQPIAPRPVATPLPPDSDHGTCHTPGTPGTPDTVIPGTPPIGDSPGTPDTVIPGIPSTPPTPYPCP